MKNKIFGVLIALVLAVTGFGLVGCGGNKQTPAPGPGPEPGPEVTYNDDTTPVLMEESVFMFTEPVSSLKTPEDGEEEEEFFVGVCGLKEAVSEAVIPAYVKDEDNNVYKVNYLDEYALTVDGAPEEVELSTEVDDEEEVLVKVTIPSTVEYISDNAFAGCIELQEIVLNNRETVIQNFNFALQDLLFELVDAGYTLEEVYELMNMEEEADGLLYFGNPQNPYMYLVTSVGEPYYDLPLSFVYPDGAVDTTDGVEVTINEDCLIVGEYVFNGSHVTKVNLPEGLLAIGDYAFNNCVNLEELEIPASVKYIGFNIVRWSTDLYVDSEHLVEDLSDSGAEYAYVLKTIADDAEELYAECLGDPETQDNEYRVYTHNDKEYYRYTAYVME